MKKNLVPISQITTADFEELDMLKVRGGTLFYDETYNGHGQCDCDKYKGPQCQCPSYNGNCVPGCACLPSDGSGFFAQGQSCFTHVQGLTCF